MWMVPLKQCTGCLGYLYQGHTLKRRKMCIVMQWAQSIEPPHFLSGAFGALFLGPPKKSLSKRKGMGWMGASPD